MKINNHHLNTPAVKTDDIGKAVDNRIIPLFRTPITLNKIQLLNKSTDAAAFGGAVKPLNQKLRIYSNNLCNYKNNIYNIILNNINAPARKYLFLNNNDKSKLKIYLKKVL